MGMNDDRVRIRLIRALQSSNGSVNYTKDSSCSSIPRPPMRCCWPASL